MKNLKCYSYIAISQTASRLSGKLLAKNIYAARLHVKQQLGYPLQCKLSSPQAMLKPSSIATLWSDLSILLQEKITLYDALQLLKNNSNQGLLCFLNNCTEKLEKGQAFSKILADFPMYCSATQRHLIYIAEQTGQLAESLTQITKHLENQDKWIKSIKKACTYPLILLGSSILICSGLLLWIMPQFASVFQNFKAPLPAFTRYMLQLSQDIKHIAPITSILVGSIIGLLITGWKKNLKIRLLMEKILLKIPLIGSCCRSIFALQWLQAMQLSLQAQLPLHTALKHSICTLKLKHWQTACKHSCDQLQQGSELSKALAHCPWLSPALQARMLLSQQHAKINKTFKFMLTYEKKNLEQLLGKITQSLEPILMLIMAVLIGGLVLAIYLPIFNLGNMM